MKNVLRFYTDRSLFVREGARGSLSRERSHPTA